MLEEGVSDHRQERVTVKALPGSSFEVIKTEFFFQLLVSLLANPSRLDCGRQVAQVRLRRQVGEIVFLLSRHPVFAGKSSPRAVPRRFERHSSIRRWRPDWLAGHVGLEVRRETGKE